MVGIILAAGDGTRLKNSTGEDCCKALKKINNMHLIEFALNNLVELNIDKVCVVVGKQGALIKEAIGDAYNGMRVSYVCQKEQKGLINALMHGIGSVEEDEDIILQLADEILVGLKAEEIGKAFAQSEYDFYCGVTFEDDENKIKNNFSVDVDEQSVIRACKEKPTEIINNIKGTGFCIFRNSAVQMLKSMYNESINIPNDLCDYMNSLISVGKSGLALFVADKEFNINTSRDLEEVLNFLNKNR